MMGSLTEIHLVQFRALDLKCMLTIPNMSDPLLKLSDSEAFLLGPDGLRVWIQTGGDSAVFCLFFLSS